MLNVLRRIFSFTSWNVDHPGEPPPGNMLDASFDAQNNRINELEALIADIRRSDGKLQNDTVTFDSLQQPLRVSLGLKGPPVPGAQVAGGSDGGESEAWAETSRLWAEHMPDTIPDDSLAEMDITGDHWSARWWAHQAANSVTSNGGAGVVIGSTPPPNPGDGQLWWENTTGNTFIYVTDPDSSSSQWVQVNYGPESGAVSSGLHEYDSQAAFQAAWISTNVAYVRLAGYTSAGDGGGHTKVRVTLPSPVRVWHSQSADGAWWQVADPDINVRMVGAKGDGVSDDAAVFRSLNDALFATGGGIVRVPPGHYALNATATRTMLSGSQGTALGPRSIKAPIFLDQGVSLVGAGRGRSKLDCINNAADISAVVVLADWGGKVKVSGLEIKGPGPLAGNAMQGIFALCSETAGYGHVMEDCELSDLYVHHVGTYGIGNNLQLRNMLVSNVHTSDTGGDGIDWKVRGPNPPDDKIPVTEGVFFENVTVRRYYQRVGAPITPSGIGIRGTASLNNIHIFDVPDGDYPGIDFTPGISDPPTLDYRRSSSMSSLSNFYVEGFNPKGTAIGVRVWAAHSVAISNGTCRWADVRAIPGVTPPDFDDGPSFNNVTIIPAAGRNGLWASDRNVSFNGCTVTSDKIYFSEKRGNLTVGQTVFSTATHGGSSTSGTAPRAVVKNDVILTDVTDYSFGANDMTLVAPVIAGDRIVIVFPPSAALRVDGVNCTGSVRMDRYCVNQSNLFPSNAVAQTCSLMIHMDGQPVRNIGMLPSAIANQWWGQLWNDNGVVKTVGVTGDGGFVQIAGGAMTGKLGLSASNPTRASLTMPHGAAPTTPVDGDMWTTVAGGLFVRISGVTRQVSLL